MKPIQFHDITKECHKLMSGINDSNMQNLYANISFKYYSCDLNNSFKSDLQNYLNNFKFIAYEYSNIPASIPFFGAQKNNNNSQNIIDIILCVENECIIIKQIEISLITQILTETKASLINTNIKTCDNKFVVEEIRNFTRNYQNYRDKNDFFNYTINPIAGYMIRRYYYPSSFFKDPSFFTFDKSIENSKEDETQRQLFDIIQTKGKEKIKEKLQLFQKNIKNCSENRYQKYTFENDDFHELRMIHSSTQFSMSLVIHLKSFHLFICKKISPDNLSEYEHEINFCRNYSHRSLTRFYGFIKKNNKILGFIYEFMSNGSIENYYNSNADQINDLYSFLSALRIFDGIRYLHSNHLIHRDIKPSNILVDHDFLPYLSDFEFVRTIEKEEGTDFTYDFSSKLYASPEQYYSKNISFSTDVYSFGAVLYFLFEKEHLSLSKLSNEKIYELIKEEKIPEMSNVSSIIQFLYLSCVKYESEDRIDLNSIEEELVNEINSFYYIEKFLKNDKINNKATKLVQYLNEIILFQPQNLETLMTTNFNTTIFVLFSFLEDHSQTLANLGYIYYKGKMVHRDYLKAKEYFELSAKCNNSEAYMLLGDIYLNGEGVEEDIEKAVKYYESSAQLMNSKAFNTLGFLYLKGQKVPKDYTKAFNYFKSAAKLDNVYGYLNLGLLYASGLGVVKDINEAEKYFEKIIQFNDPSALVNLGYEYYIGEYIEKDIKKAIKYYELAAQQNDEVGLFNLGNLYQNGNYVQKDILKAKEYFESSAQKNFPPALFSLGNLYLQGQIIEKDYDIALHYFELAAQYDYSLALYALGNMYLFGQGVQKDVNKALKYYERSGEHNDSDSLLMLGNLYYNGDIIQQDISKAILYYEKAAKLNNDEALNMLGLIYDAEGINKDSKKAFEYFERSAKMNNHRAQLNLASKYLNGNGVAKDYTKAKMYFELASQENDPLSLYNLGLIYLNGLNVEKDLEKAKHYFELAAQQNHPYVLFLLGNTYLNEKEIPYNIPLAIKYFILSAQQNNSDACLALGNIFSQGQFVNKDIQKAKQYFEKAAQLNHPDAYRRIGLMYFINQDYFKARYYFELAARNNNNSDALFSLGALYAYGLGVQKDMSKSIECFEQSAKLHNLNALVILGQHYHSLKNYEKAKDFYEEAASYKNPFAFLCLGNMYFYGEGVSKNYSKAGECFEQFDELIKLNNDPSNFNIYNFTQIDFNNFLSLNLFRESQKRKESFESFIQGNGTEFLMTLGDKYLNDESIAKAKECYEIAANQNNSNAYIRLGLFYFFGKGVERDINKAKENLEIASKLNNPIAFYYLGCLYYIEQNYTKAIECFKVSAESNDSLSIYFLGWIYENGNGVDINFPKAKEYYERAANLNNSLAIFKLGFLYDKGFGVKQNFSRAKEYYEKAASRYNIDAIYNLGVLYFCGKGVQKDFYKAKELFELTIKYGYPEGYNSLGIMYLYGIAVVKDIPKARYYFEIFSKFNSNGSYNLGMLYLFNLEKPDYLKAIEYFKIASEDNNSYALLLIAIIYISGIGVKQDYQQANHYLKRSAELGNSFAYFQLGLSYLNGYGVEKNFKEAKYYFEVSAEKDNPIALYTLGYIYNCSEYTNVDIQKAKKYFQRCIDVFDEHYFVKNDIFLTSNNIEILKHFSYNNLALIYLTNLFDTDKAENYIKIPAFAGFPFSQNSLGLMYQFHFKNDENAIRMYEKASKHKFALAEYNLGFLKEKENKIDDALVHYENASKYEDEKLIFKNNVFEDRKLKISTTFIICLTNLKLAKFYFSKSNYAESKKYFIKSFSKFNISETYRFKFQYDKYNIDQSFSYISNFILNFPLFDFKNQPELNLNLKSKLESNEEEEKKNFEYYVFNEKLEIKQREISTYYFKDENKFVFNDPGDLFDFAIENDEIKNVFFNELIKTIQIMMDILYTPPYYILFGRINITKSTFDQNKSTNSFVKDISKLFYEGFGEEI